MIRLDKLLSNLGYGSRNDVKKFLQQGVVTSVDGEKLKSDTKVDAATIRFNGEKLDPLTPLTIILNKPKGYVCSRDDQGKLVFELLPERMNCRTPAVSIAGRLDKDSQGLLLLTDDGELLHRITHPATHVEKEYIVEVARPFRGDEKALFGSGTFELKREERTEILLPAEFTAIGDKKASITLHEGKNRQIRRMFEVLGNDVVFLKRVRIGEIVLPEDLEEGEWRYV